MQTLTGLTLICLEIVLVCKMNYILISTIEYRYTYIKIAYIVLIGIQLRIIP